MSPYLGSGLVAVALIVASVGPKLWIQRHSAQVDVDRLDGEISRRLESVGFRTWVDRKASGAAVHAWRGDCRLIARNGDRARELEGIFRLEAADYGPVAIGYRNFWSPHPASARAVAERFVQDGAARLGVDFGRPAVIALAQSGPCPGVREVLSHLAAHSATTEVAPPPET